jgi:hypothetical protein
MAEGKAKEGKKMKLRRKRGDGCVYLRGRMYWVKYFDNGKPVCESSGSIDENEAQRYLHKRLGEIATGNFIGPDAERVKLSDLADDVVTDYRVNEQSSLPKAIRSANRIKAFFGNAKAHSIKGSAIKRFFAQRQTDGAANASINRELAFVKRCYNLGIETERIVRKPYIAMLEENNVRSGFFEHGEFIAFRSALPDYLKPVVTFAYYTGWRRRRDFESHMGASGFGKPDGQAQSRRDQEQERPGDRAGGRTSRDRQGAMGKAQGGNAAGAVPYSAMPVRVSPKRPADQRPAKGMAKSL